jgi:hypothetical protein
VTLLDHLRDYLVEQGLVRAPDDPGVGARPWLPPAYRHPPGGPIGPGDAADANLGLGEDAVDDGIVLSIMFAPGIPPGPDGAETRILGVDLNFRADAPAKVDALEGEIRDRLLDAANGYPPGGRCDWIMAGLYVIQSTEFRSKQPLPTDGQSFAFVTGYLFEVRA